HRLTPLPAGFPLSVLSNPNLLINWKTSTQILDLAPDRLLDGGGITRIGRLGVHDLADPFPDLLEFGLAEAARGRRGCPEANTRSDRRLFGVIGDAVLVTGHTGALEQMFDDIAGELLRAKVDQHQVRVRAAGNDFQAALA